ncbi:Fic family protein [Rathayibacter sp. VKM Ac-2803]|uniref:Fic family protein n=1 Tax=Rathayibacter sp. VKM Ac-2803 TaxID=2609256 RepID=UPI0013585A23|nr:Fic family protein [Rathayibacter sp. VKM Ac-2803]MWV47697.1 Fic family protein [Rathayibacter sp. VKM Ac-2803]
MSAWPALDHESVPWTSQLRRDDLTRRQWDASRGPYTASIPPRIADVPVQISPAVAAEAADASALLTRFDAELGASVLPFASILLRSESASSSQIENLTSGARAIAETELGERDTGNAALIVRNVRAMTAALALTDGIDSDGIIAMHAALLSGHAPELTGAYRSQQVWIGGSSVSPHQAGFVPPIPERVPAAMDDLIEFIARSDVPALAHSAIAHAQFETIHPFPDGNGRTGRALVQAMLRTARLTRTVTVPVSAGLLHDVDAYYAALGRYREGDVDAMVLAFSDASVFAVRSGRELAEDIEGIRGTWRDALAGLRSDHSARRVADLALEQPVLSGPVVGSRLGISAPAAYRALDALVECGVLRPADSHRRNRIWIADRMIAALDAFTERAARRRIAGGEPRP